MWLGEIDKISENQDLRLEEINKILQNQHLWQGEIDKFLESQDLKRKKKKIIMLIWHKIIKNRSWCWYEPKNDDF